MKQRVVYKFLLLPRSFCFLALCNDSPTTATTEGWSAAMLIPSKTFIFVEILLLVFLFPFGRCLNENVFMKRQSSNCGTDPDWQPTTKACKLLWHFL